MVTINGKTYLTVGEMEQCGIPYTNIKAALRRNARGCTAIKDPGDRRKLLIEFDDMNARWKNKVMASMSELQTLQAKNSADTMKELAGRVYMLATELKTLAQKLEEALSPIK